MALCGIDSRSFRVVDLDRRYSDTFFGALTILLPPRRLSRLPVLPRTSTSNTSEHIYFHLTDKILTDAGYLTDCLIVKPGHQSFTYGPPDSLTSYIYQPVPPFLSPLATLPPPRKTVEPDSPATLPHTLCYSTETPYEASSHGTWL